MILALMPIKLAIDGRGDGNEWTGSRLVSCAGALERRSHNMEQGTEVLSVRQLLSGQVKCCEVYASMGVRFTKVSLRLLQGCHNQCHETCKTIRNREEVGSPSFLLSQTASMAASSSKITGPMYVCGILLVCSLSQLLLADFPPHQPQKLLLQV